jgi:hypothetical protein
MNMAKQVGHILLERRTIGDLVFYKMDGQHYVRLKSSLTGKRVKTSPRFRRTMFYASLMGRASKIGSLIYKALPENWRQFWMYRAFTGEALTMLKEGKNEEEIKNFLWKIYVQPVTQKAKVQTETTKKSATSFIGYVVLKNGVSCRTGYAPSCVKVHSSDFTLRFNCTRNAIAFNNTS